MAEVAADSGIARTGRDGRGPSAPSRRRSPRSGPATRSAAIPASSTRARPSGCRVFGSAERAGGPAPARCAPAAAADHALAGEGGARLARQRAEARPGRLAVPLGRRAAGGLPGRGRPGRGRRAVRRCATRPPSRRCARRPPRTRRPTCGRCWATSCACSRAGGRRRRLLSGRADMAHAAGPDRHARPARPAGAARLRRRTPGPPRCAATRRTSRRSRSAASG